MPHIQDDSKLWVEVQIKRSYAIENGWTDRENFCLKTPKADKKN